MNWCSRSRKLNELTSQDDLHGAWPELWKYRRLTRKLRFYLWFATAYWERGTSFTCDHVPRRVSMKKALANYK
jgi:hypothetical protein